MKLIKKIFLIIIVIALVGLCIKMKKKTVSYSKNNFDPGSLSAVKEPSERESTSFREKLMNK